MQFQQRSLSYLNVMLASILVWLLLADYAQAPFYDMDSGSTPHNSRESASVEKTYNLKNSRLPADDDQK